MQKYAELRVHLLNVCQALFPGLGIKRIKGESDGFVLVHQVMNRSMQTSFQHRSTNFAQAIHFRLKLCTLVDRLPVVPSPVLALWLLRSPLPSTLHSQSAPGAIQLCPVCANSNPSL